MKYPTSIDKEEINLLPPMEFAGEIIEVETLPGALKAIELLSQEKMVGFDTETRPAFVKGESYTPALLQLATRQRAYIFRLKFYEPPKELGDLLSNPDVLKIGVGISDDLRGLKRIIDFHPAGFVDLSLEVRKRGFTSEGLRALTAIFLGRRLIKGSTRTNWERKDLTSAQIKYAAADAAVGLLIYEKILGLD